MMRYSVAVLLGMIPAILSPIELPPAIEASGGLRNDGVHR